MTTDERIWVIGLFLGFAAVLIWPEMIISLAPAWCFFDGKNAK